MSLREPVDCELFDLEPVEAPFDSDRSM